MEQTSQPSQTGDDKYMKYMDLFRKSRSVVKAFEEDFKVKQGRKPERNDLAKAPEHVLTCIKNCRKIQAYFKLKGDQSQLSTSGSKDEGEEVATKQKPQPPPAQDLETPTLDAILEPKAKSKSMWGSHLNKDRAKPGAMRRHKTESNISKGPSFSGFFNEASQSSQKTRLSLKKGSAVRKSSARSFFDTLGGGDLEASTLPSPPANEATEKKFVDPLSRFDPEISMGGDDNSDDLVFGPKFGSVIVDPQQQQLDDPGKCQKPVKPFNHMAKPIESNKRQALSVLSVLSSQKQDSSSRLSFSGLFPKATTPVKAHSLTTFENLADDNDDNGNDEQSDAITTKRKRVDSNNSDDGENSPRNSLPETKKTRIDFQSLESDVVPTKTVDVVVDPASKELPKNDIYAIGFEEADDDPRGFASAKQVNRFTVGKKAGQNMKTENYVKINLKKKNFVRGKKTMTGSKYRRQEWKRKELEKTKKGANKKVKQVDENSQRYEDGEDEDMDAIMAEMNSDNPFPSEIPQGEESTQPPIPTRALRFDDYVTPYFGADVSDDEKRRDLQQALRKFGHVTFRPGQYEAMVKILSGESSLVVSATGSGKSLIYQLPAYLYGQRSPSITLVISPLVSLMEDQITGLPPFIRAACLHFNQTERIREKVLEEIKSGELHFLLLSPETIAGGGSLFGRVLQSLPPIAFVCIDEAHCVSQWSHNFRPAYLRLAKVVREKLGVNIILGLTATAPDATLSDCATRLGVDPESGIVRGPFMPDNLTLTVSKDKDREKALLELLKTEPFASFDSIIIYCTRREDCDRTATLLRTNLELDQSSGTVKKNGKTRTSVTAESYHAGLTAYRRRTIQNQFMSGKLRVVIATVAFGMGIDKSDIRGIIHYNMPKTFENYVQEIGRAGRDGKPARCHLFMDSEGGAVNLNELRRYIHSNSVDRHTVRKLIDTIFGKTSTTSDAAAAVGGDQRVYQEVALPISDLVQQLDMPEENISTLLCYLESHDKRWVKLLNPVYANCTIRSYKGPAALQRLAATNRIVAEALKTQKNWERAAEIQFSVVDLAAQQGWESAVVKRELKNLQWQVGNNSKIEKSGILVEFCDLAFHFMALRNLSEDDLEEVLDFLYNKIVIREKSELASLFRAHRAFSTVAQSRDSTQESQTEKSNKLKDFVREYFSEATHETDDKKIGLVIPPLDPQAENAVRADVRQFVMTHTDHVWSGRAVARVFHGIESPNFRAIQWGRVRRFWRAHLSVDFNVLCKIATQEVIKLRSR